MYKATRQLIRDRQPFCRFKLEKVAVKQIGGGDFGMCCYNSDNAKDKDLLNTGSTDNRMVSGWIVGPFDKERGETGISQHWWNKDSATDEYFDTTPIEGDTIPTQYEYVVDDEIGVYGMEVFDQLASNVTKDLVLLNGRWYAEDQAFEDGTCEINEIPDLSNQNIFILKKAD